MNVSKMLQVETSDEKERRRQRNMIQIEKFNKNLQDCEARREKIEERRATEKRATYNNHKTRSAELYRDSLDAYDIAKNCIELTQVKDLMLHAIDKIRIADTYAEYHLSPEDEKYTKN